MSAEPRAETASLPGGVATRVIEAAPDGPPRGACVIVHGLAEHAGRYGGVQRHLARAGYASVSFDLRGHGHADGWPGKVETPDAWIEDLAAVVERARDRAPAPRFIVAHSMGTLVALAYLAERGGEGVAGVVLSGTAVAPGEAMLASLGDPDAPGIPADLLSHDPEVARAYREDELVFADDIPPECTAAVMLCAGRAFEGAPSVELPALLLHGGADGIVDPSGSREVHEALGSADKTLVVYDGMYHEIFNETDRDRVLDDVVAWLDARAPR